MTVKPRVLWTAVCGLAIAGLLVGFRPNDTSLAQALLGVGILAVGVTPGLIFLWGKHPAPIPTFPVANLFYVVCFGLPVFLAPVIWPQVAGGATFHYHGILVADRVDFLDVRALTLVLAGMALASVAYYAAAKLFPQRMPQFTLPQQINNRRVVLLLGLLLAGHAAYLFIPALRPLPSIGQFLEPVGYLAFGGFYWLWRDRRLSLRTALVIFGVLLPIVILKKLTGGLLTPVILFGLFFFFLAGFFRHRLALAVAGLCALVVLGGYGPLTDVRLNTWGDPAFKSYSPAEKLEHAFHDRQPNLTLGEKLVGSAGLALNRTAFLAMFSRVVDQTPESVPYWNGETYKPLLTSFIPRALWRGKPEERIGYSVGIRYGFTFPGLPVETSMNLPWIIEMFMNFGVPGVLIGMSLIGILLAFLDRVFNRPGMTPLEAVVGLTVIFPLAYPDSNFSLMTGSLLPLTLALWVYFRVGLTAFPGWEGRIADRFDRRRP